MLPMQNHDYTMKKLSIAIYLFAALLLTQSVWGQNVQIDSYTINNNGQAQLEFNSTSEEYYVLRIQPNIDSSDYIDSKLIMGQDNETVITDQLAAYPESHYQIIRYRVDTPADIDRDGINDIEELQNVPSQNPINAAPSIDMSDGTIMIESFDAFKLLSIQKEEVQWSEFLNGKEFVKFLIIDNGYPQVYFLNSNTHSLHADFASALNIDILSSDIIKGQIIYHPASISSNGTVGTFAFNYSNGRSKEFDIVQKTHELLAANMPFIENNLSYFITDNSEAKYDEDKMLYDNSRVSVLHESDIYANVDYWGINQEEGYGLLRQMTLEEIPGPKDIVLYESIPNSLPRVGGIITSVIQTPLSHVNLRAIQNNVPNAYIKNPLEIDSIAALLGEYIYFRADQERYVIRKATIDEVNDWYHDIRPTEEQSPLLNLDYTDILPLDEIDFDMYDAFGAKCSNLATMRTFGFPDQTIPDGYGIPFYFYQEFMQYNGFFDLIREAIEQPNFIADRDIRNEILKDIRTQIKKADMPQWMLDRLDEMHKSFPEGTSVRCRSSSNNEDLQGFNGAGLYDSKTQHPDEGHISKSVKQVYASLWNLRAFEERDFYRVNHYETSMGVLCHPNYSDEKANGVGVSLDPLYGSSNTFYFNTQLGEDLITNPESNSIPEEILLYKDIDEELDYIVLQNSNLVESNEIILNPNYLHQIRTFLNVIHDEFEILYDAVGNEEFAVDIEYKITATDQLIIKQARPWVHFNQEEEEEEDNHNSGEAFYLNVYPNPTGQNINIDCNQCNITQVIISNTLGQQIMNKTIISDSPNSNIAVEININLLPSGTYILSAYRADNTLYGTRRIVVL